MTLSTKSPLWVPSSFISIFKEIFPLQVFKASSRDGILMPPKAGPILSAGWTAFISSSVRSRIFASFPMIRFKLQSWKTTGTLSFVSFTSSSIQSEPLSIAFSKAGSVFSSAFKESPLWAVISTWSIQEVPCAYTGIVCPKTKQAVTIQTAFFM